MIMAAIKQREVDERVTLGRCAGARRARQDGQAAQGIDHTVRSGGRADLVAKEAAEIALLQEYLPAQLSAAEIDALISAAISTHRRRLVKDMGKVMGVLKASRRPRRHGRGQRPDQTEALLSAAGLWRSS